LAHELLAERWPVRPGPNADDHVGRREIAQEDPEGDQGEKELVRYPIDGGPGRDFLPVDRLPGGDPDQVGQLA
jgi:hypothetical protein